MTLTRRQVRELLARHGTFPSRSRGQNFVVDPNTVRRVARLAEVAPGDRVIEVGGGVGSLTLALAETGAEVTTVEVDPHLVPALREVVEPVGVTVVHADAMTLDWAALLAGAPEWTLVANLPYNIATPLIADLLDNAPAIRRMVVMVQREVAERLAAQPGQEAYGAVSVKVAYWADARVVARVPSTVFWPEPNVESAVVDIRRHPTPSPAADREWLFRLVSAGFGQRRKMLRRSLAGLVSPSDLVRPEARAEELGLEAWLELAARTAPPPG